MSTSEFEIEQEQEIPVLLQIFEVNLRFLEKFAILLSLGNGEEERLILGKELAPISNKYENCDDHVLFNTIEVYYEFKQELGKVTGDHELDISYKLFEIFGYGLNLILFLIREGTEPMEILQLYKRFHKCIIVFSATPIILNKASFNEMVIAWIFELLRIITGADGVSKLVTEKYAVFNTIKWILVSLGRSDIFRGKIISGICHNITCAMSYCAANEQFKDYVFLKTMVLEYLLWTLRDLVYDAATSKVILGNVCDNVPEARIRLALESLEKFFGDKLPSFIKKFIDDILGL